MITLLFFYLLFSPIIPIFFFFLFLSIPLYFSLPSLNQNPTTIDNAMIADVNVINHLSILTKQIIFILINYNLVMLPIVHNHVVEYLSTRKTNHLLTRSSLFSHQHAFCAHFWLYSHFLPTRHDLNIQKELPFHYRGVT